MRNLPLLLILALAPVSAEVPSRLSGTAVDEARNFTVDKDPGAVPADGQCSTGKCRREQVVTRQGSPLDNGGTDLPPTPAPSFTPSTFLKDYGPTMVGGAGGLLLGLGVGLGLAALGVAGPVVAVAAVCGLILGLVIGHKFLAGLFGK